jgi:hypothetical protein
VEAAFSSVRLWQQVYPRSPVRANRPGGVNPCHPLTEADQLSADEAGAVVGSTSSGLTRPQHDRNLFSGSRKLTRLMIRLAPRALPAEAGRRLRARLCGGCDRLGHVEVMGDLEVSSGQ